MSPAATPDQPAIAAVLTPGQSQTQQVIQAATVDTDVDNLDLRQELVQRQALSARSLPEVSTRPAIRPQCKANLYVQVLGKEADKRIFALLPGLFELLAQELLIDRQTEVRVGDVGIGEVPMCASSEHGLRELVEHRQEARILDNPVTHLPGVVQLLQPYPGRRIVCVRGGVDDKAFGPGHQT